MRVDNVDARNYYITEAIIRSSHCFSVTGANRRIMDTNSNPALTVKKILQKTHETSLKFTDANLDNLSPVSCPRTMIRRPHFFLEYHLDALRAQGRHTFTLPDLRQQFDISDQALGKALQRLKQKKKAICLRKGFFVITPIPTLNLFIPDLMKFLNKNYYTGLLSAAAHHLPGSETSIDYHIITTKPVLLPIRTNQLNINFYYKRKWQQNDIVDNISSPELTALDLVHYADRLGSLNKIIEALDFLTEIMDVEALVVTAKNYADTTTVQRLGYILHEILYNGPFAESLIDYLKTTRYYPVLLHPQKEKPENMVSGNIWRVVPNIKINDTHTFS
jgi:hypothetical protein